jgi:transcription elongation GreA/GreB family factor
MFPKIKISLGSKVLLIEESTREKISFTLVDPSPIVPTGDKIGSSGPIGRILLGHKIGDVIIIKTLKGKKKCRVLDIV